MTDAALAPSFRLAEMKSVPARLGSGAYRKDCLLCPIQELDLFLCFVLFCFVKQNEIIQCVVDFGTFKKKMNDFGNIRVFKTGSYM